MDAVKILLLFVGFAQISAQDYCDPQLCSGRRHIACNNNGSWEPGCDGRLIDIEPHSNTILQLHNERRNTVAAGRLPGFPSAVQMATMSWDAELARVATFNAQRCRIEHDECRNTRDFRYAGQNLSILSTQETSIDVNSFINRSIESWFNEYRDATRNDVERYQRRSGGMAIGHFTTMVNERNSRIGCAISQFTTQDRIFSSYLVCNYAVTNIVDVPVYRFGDAGSGCTSGRSESFESLCSTRELYNYNEWSS